MTESEASPPPASPAELPVQLEARLARLEAQLRAHADRLAELDDSARRRRQQGLWLRLMLLAAALAAFFFLRARMGS